MLTNGTEDYPFTLLTVSTCFTVFNKYIYNLCPRTAKLMKLLILFLCQVIILKASGIIIPMYIIIKILGAIQSCIQHYKDADYDTSMSEEDDEDEIHHNVNPRHL